MLAVFGLRMLGWNLKMCHISLHILIDQFEAVCALWVIELNELKEENKQLYVPTYHEVVYCLKFYIS